MSTVSNEDQFNVFKEAEYLLAAGFSEQQSSAIAKVVDDGLKSVVGFSKQEFQIANEKTRKEIDITNKDLKIYVNSLNSRIDNLEKHIDTKFAAQTVNLMKWLIPTFLAQTALMVAIIQMMHL